MAHDQPAATLTSRQRVLAALEHRQPDRVPRDLGGTTATGINIVAYRNLVRHMGLEEEPTLFSERVRLANLSPAVLARFRSDSRPVMPGGAFGVGEPVGDGACVVRRAEVRRARDGYGIVRALPPDECGHWYVVRSPLCGPRTRADVAAAARGWPDPTDPAVTSGVAERARALHHDTDCAVVLNLPLGSIHVAQWLRGFEDWLADLVLDPELSIYLLDCLLERWLETAHRLIEAVGDNVDVLFFGEDVALHSGPMVSPDTYVRIIQPYQRRVFRALHDWSDAKILYHNCGSVIWQIEDMIEMGVDALNPVQVNSRGMDDTAALKRRFGDRIVFWGGVDVQQFLPQATPSEVRDHVRELIRVLGQDGGYVMAPAHNMQDDIPPENIVAWVEAVQGEGNPS